VDIPFAFEQGGDHGTPFVHVELNTSDVAKAKEFYQKLFEWKLQDVPMPGGNTYTMIDVGGGTGGGIMKVRRRARRRSGWPVRREPERVPLPVAHR